MKELKCSRCGHRWYPRSEKKPKSCPACNSRVWDKPKKTKQGAAK